MYFNLGKTISICFHTINLLIFFNKKNEIIIKNIFGGIIFFMLSILTNLWALSFAKMGSTGSFGSLGSLEGLKGLGGIGGIGKTGLLGKLGIIMLLSRFGLHGIWATGALIMVAFLVVVGLFYSVYRFRMRNI